MTPPPAPPSRENAAPADQQAFYRALLDAQSSAGIGLFMLEGGKVAYANEAGCAIYGYSEEDLRALPSFDVLIHPDDRARVMHNHQRRLAGEEFENRYNIGITTRTGARREAEITVAPLLYGQGMRLLVIMVDVTARCRAEAEIRKLNTELEERVSRRTAELSELNHELESFAYSISHDLRAPLRGIDGFSRLLQEEYGERLDAQGNEYLMRVRRATQRLGTLIDDLLELSRVTRHEMRGNAVELSALAADIVEDLRKAEPERAVAVRIEPHCVVRGDPQLLRVLLENLIGNAWKYSRPASAAQIEFGREVAEQESCFFVRDNGAGFDMAYADKLFAPFQRLHHATEFEGSGIGLASAARVVRRHGGRIWAEGAPGQGAVFRFTLDAPAGRRDKGTGV